MGYQKVACPLLREPQLNSEYKLKGSVEITVRGTPDLGLSEHMLFIGTYSSALTITIDDHFIPFCINVTPSGDVAKWVILVYPKLTTGAAMASANFAAIAPRITIAHNITAVYGIQNHITRTAGDISSYLVGTSAKVDKGTSGSISGEVFAAWFIITGSVNPTGRTSALCAETQGTSEVDEIALIRANTGATVTGQVLYVVSHVNATAGICINAAGGTTARGLDTVGTITSILYLRSTTTNFIEASASGKGGVTVSSDGMHRDPEDHAEAGYITIKVGTTTYQVPFYASS